MVIAADGTKWSCLSCLKGHRVSGCNHTDRELKLVPKKGRPVTQCQHCRQERKKRSAHVKCDCAEPEKPHHSKEKCIHLREAEDRNKTAHYDDPIHHDRDIAHMTAVAEEQGCCCHHGGKCSCALLRKDSTDGDTPGLTRARSVATKPRLESTRSDSSITTIYSDAHHRLTHRNHAAHECGMPYKIPMSRAKTDQHFPRVMRRSVDNLGLGSNAASVFAPTSTPQPAPTDMATLFGDAAGLTSNKLGVIDFAAIDATATGASDSAFALDSDADPTIDPSFGDWSAFSSNDLLNIANDGQPALSISSTDALHLAQPALTAASSGTQSEIDEIPAIEDVFAHGMPSIQEMADFSQNTDSFDATSQANRRSLPPNFFGNVDFSVPVPDDDWQAQGLPNVSGIFGKSMQDLNFNDPWQSSNTQAKTSFGNALSQQRSVGNNGSGGSDVLRQLFPDMDLDSSYPASSPRQRSSKVFASQSSDTIGHGLTRTVSGQAWPDGSMSIPDDSYAAGYP